MKINQIIVNELGEGVQPGVAEGLLNELDMFAPVTTYVRLANGEYVAASWRRNQDLSGGNNASFIDIKPLAPNVAKQLGLDQRLNDPDKNYNGVASIASGGGVQSSTPFSDKTIDVVDIMDPKFAKDMGVPDAVFGKIAQWGQQQAVAENNRPFRGVGGAFDRGDDERHDLDPTDWYIVKDGEMFSASIYPRQVQQAISQGFSRTRAEAKARANSQGEAEGVTENSELDPAKKKIYNQVYQILVTRAADFMYRANNQDVKKAIIKAMSFGDQISPQDLASYAFGLLKSGDINSQGVAEGSGKECPPATQDIKLNLKNRQKAIDEYGYGPLNPDMPNTKFWMKKVDEWNLDSAEEAKQSLCGNCAAFDQRKHTLDCIAQGIDSNSPNDAEGVIDAGDLGYCKFLKFKCASRRTCDAWVTGGPLTDANESAVLETARKGLDKQGVAEAGNANSGRRGPDYQDNSPVVPGRVEHLPQGLRHHADASRYGGTEPNDEDDRLLSPQQRHRLHRAVTPDDWFDESKEKIAGRHDPDDFDNMVARLKQLAGAGPLKTVWDPARRVYRNVPQAVQPPQQPKKATQ